MNLVYFETPNCLVAIEACSCLQPGGGGKQHWPSEAPLAT